MELDKELLNTKWVKLEIIKQGSYGIVYRGYDSSNNQIIAIKKLKTPIDEDGIQVEPLREVIILRNISHPNIVRYTFINFRILDAFCTIDKMIIIFEFMQMDLSVYIEKFQLGVPIDLVKVILRQILKGLRCVHSEGILHRDLKPHNILLNIDMNGTLEVKLADFGLARSYSKTNISLTKYTSI
jgi:serine/threonine protein kinase